MKVNAAIRDLRIRVRDLETQKDDHIDGPTSAFTALIYLFGAQIIGGIILFSNVPTDGALWDFMAYILPCIAGAAAGFGLFRKPWVVQSFVISVALLWLAFICYLLSKGVGRSYIVVTGGIAGMAISAFLIIKRVVEYERSKSQKIPPGIALFISLFFISLFLFFVGGIVFFDDTMAAQGRWHPSLTSQSTSFKTATSIPKHGIAMQNMRKAGKCAPPLLWIEGCLPENILLMTRRFPKASEYGSVR